MPAVNTIQLRRDAAATWTSVNPVLAAGEVGLETDTRLMKAGNGSSTWTALPYLAIPDGIVTTGKLASTASIRLVNDKSFMVQTTQPTTRPGGGALVTGDVWISYTP